MKLLALLAIALSLLSASPADARHHHRGWQAQHGAVPMLRERPAAVWTAPQATVAQQLVLIGMWRLQTDQFYRR